MPLKPVHFHHIRTKLVIRYWLAFLVVMIMTFGAAYTGLRNSVIKSVETALTLQVDLIKNSIATAAEASIKNYYRAMAHSALTIIESCYNRFKEGELSEQEAQDLAWSMVQNIRPGPSGYLAIVNSQNVFAYHPYPEYIGMDITGFDFFPLLKKDEEVYFSYKWRNPGDKADRDKLSYNIYYTPWNWHIATTGYRDDLASLINLKDFKDNILSIKFGDTGYPIIIGNDGTLLVHPEYEGINMIDREGPMGDVVRQSLEERNGRVDYLWQNPGEKKLHKKLSLFSEIEPYGFILAVTTYRSEFMKPIRDMTRLFLLALFFALLTIGYLSLRVSRSITLPVLELKMKMDQAAEGDLSVRSDIYSSDEVGEIGRHFNNLIEILESKQRELEEQLNLNSTITEQLRRSLKELQQTQQKLIEEERFSNMGRLLARMSHHLNTPLGTSITTLSCLKEDIRKLPDYGDTVTESLSGMIELLESSLNKAVELLESFKLLDISRKGFISMEVEDFLKIIYLNKWKSELPEGVTIQSECPDDFRIHTNPELLQSILDQLTSNSLLHSFNDRQEGLIRVTFYRESDTTILEYSDNGTGIPEEDSSRLFEPFYNRDRDFQSRGIGLNIVYNTVAGSLGGSIRYTGSVDKGVHYIITLPEKS
ncbi:MAG: cache domain-containing protein [Spirochaetales bacterium]|nr:cache domain-containing protein [Spirochaetales bacterium]